MRPKRGGTDKTITQKNRHFIDKVTSRLSLRPQPRIETEASLYRDEVGNEYWIPAGPMKGEWEAGEYPMWFQESIDFVRHSQPVARGMDKLYANAKLFALHKRDATPERIAESVEKLSLQKSEEIQKTIDQLQHRFGDTLSSVQKVLSALDDAVSASSQFFVKNARGLAAVANPSVSYEINESQTEELAAVYRSTFEASSGSVGAAASAIEATETQLNKTSNPKSRSVLRQALHLIQDLTQYLDFGSYYENLTELDKHPQLVMKYIAQNPKAFSSAIIEGEAVPGFSVRQINEFYSENRERSPTMTFWATVGIKSVNDKLDGKHLDEILNKDQEYAKFKAKELGSSNIQGWASFTKQRAVDAKTVTEGEQEFTSALENSLEHEMENAKNIFEPKKLPIPDLVPSYTPSISISTKEMQPGAVQSPGYNKIVLETFVYQWGLSEPAKKRMLALCGDRMNRGSGRLRLPVARFPEKQANIDYAFKLLYALLHEASKADESEKYHIVDEVVRVPTPVERLAQQLGNYQSEDEQSLTLFDTWKNSELRRGETGSDQEQVQVEEQDFLSDERLGLFGDAVVEDEFEEELGEDEDLWNW